MTRQMIAAAGLLALALGTGEAAAQAFEPGPPGTPTGTSMAGASIVGAPKLPRGNRIPNARVFGDTAEERAYGRDFDDSYITPEVPRGIGRKTTNPARAGRSDIDPTSAGDFARGGPAAIGQSSVTRGSSFSRGSRGGRARIVNEP
ncbi:hypothetical protein Sa4125_38320 [Aureimonas sp. SA4125]|uniref:hypothetical protein n=1 Tax=Aureimonas sp. SA4125 TaxID=2826993 RepID=UPI001CC45878|nr:hypothetical protein [Aureimonas sp. SA4125]BDA86290.1 hypothetical protein Sa4125_38320 [Aureimonas sp. SA4125]